MLSGLFPRAQPTMHAITSTHAATWFRRGFTLLIPLVLTVPAGAGGALELTTAISRALDHNRDILVARFQAQASEFNITEQEAAFDFRLAPVGSMSTGEDRDTIGYGLALARRVSWGTDLSVGMDLTRATADGAPDYQRGSLNVRVDQPLFRDAGRLVQLEPIRLARSQYLQALRQLEQTKADIVLAVVARHQDLLRLERLIEADTQRLQRLDRLRRLTELREKQGSATRLDVMRVALQHGQSGTSLETHRAQQEAAQRLYADLLGEPPDQRYTPDAPPRLHLQLPPAAAAADTALSNRLDYAQALADIADARRGERIAYQRQWPDVRLVARVEQSGSGPAERDALDLDETLVGISLGGNTDLLRRRDRAAYQATAIDTAAVLLQGEIARDRVLRAVYDELSAYGRAGEEFVIASRNLDVARQRLDLAARLFGMGRADSLAVSDAEEAFLLAQNEENSASSAAAVAGYRVLHAMGTLIETAPELKPAAFP